jgi:hypothetical protein
MAARTLLALIAVAAALAACGGGDDAPEGISLRGEELRAFLSTLLLTADDVPGALPDVQDRWLTDPEPAGRSDILGDFDPEAAGWLGTISRDFFVRVPTGRTFAVPAGISAFEDTSGAEQTLDALKAIDLDDLRAEYMAGQGVTDLRFVMLEIDAGDDSFVLAYSGSVELEGQSEELVSVLFFFRRGPLLAFTGMAGYVELDEAFVRDLAQRLDERIAAGLAAQ